MYELFSLAGYRTVFQASTAQFEGRSFQERYKVQLKALSDRSSAQTGSSSGPLRDQQSSSRQRRSRGLTDRRKQHDDDYHTNDTGQDESSSSKDSASNDPVYNTPRRWLLLCFDHRTLIPKIEHVRLVNEANDQDLFPRLRKKYYSHKHTWLMRCLGLTRFVVYLTSYKIKKASFVKVRFRICGQALVALTSQQFRLLPDERSSKGMPSRLDEWEPDRYWQPSGWDLAQIGDRPIIDTKWFLCHWAHPDEEWLRFWRAIRETWRDINLSSNTLAARVTAITRSRMALQASKRLFKWLWRSIADNIHWLIGIRDGNDLEQAVSISAVSRDPDADQDRDTPRDVQTILQCSGRGVPVSRFLVTGPKKVRTRLVPRSDKPPDGWGLYIHEEKKPYGIVFVMTASFFVLNVALFGYVIREKLYSVESMVLSACSLMSGIVLFLSKG